MTDNGSYATDGLNPNQIYVGIRRIDNCKQHHTTPTNSTMTPGTTLH